MFTFAYLYVCFVRVIHRERERERKERDEFRCICCIRVIIYDCKRLSPFFLTLHLGVCPNHSATTSINFYHLVYIMRETTAHKTTAHKYYNELWPANYLACRNACIYTPSPSVCRRNREVRKDSIRVMMHKCDTHFHVMKHSYHM